jgi:serine protein kinase
MSELKSQFLDIIQEQREQKTKKKFKGTFIDYLDLVQKNPDIVKLSHKRVFDTIMEEGYEVLDESNPRIRKVFEEDKIKVFNYFKKNFFGTEKVIYKLMKFLQSAAYKGEESRQILLLMGPVGSGKSALSEHIKRALEAADPYYFLDGCPIREEPLHLLPRSLRDKFSNLLGVHIEGDLCPSCRFRLINEFNGKYEDFPVVAGTFSVRDRRGIGVVPPQDPNAQDVSILIGTEDISKLDKFPEDDPRVLSLNGAFNVGNRGIVEFVEIFKNEIEFIHPAITATQEKLVPAPGKHPMVYHDLFILSHCNEAEWAKFRSNNLNEAIMDRIYKIEVPYVLELSEEEKIYKKRLGESDFKAHIAPHTLKIASMFSIMTRLKESAKCDLLTKLKIYNGEEIVEKGRVRKVDIKDLREESQNEGMTGISTRFVMKAIDNAIASSDNDTITPISVIDSLIRYVKEQIIDEEKKKHYLSILQKTIREEYLKILEKEIGKAFIQAYEPQAESLFNTYLDHAEAYTMQQQIKDPITKEVRDPDEDFLEAIEEQIGITGTSREGFRKDITGYMFSRSRRNETIDYKTHAGLREAIENYMLSSVKDMARVVTKSRARDEEQKKKYTEMIETLIEEYGYNENSAEEILTYAANNLWRDS